MYFVIIVVFLVYEVENMEYFYWRGEGYGGIYYFIELINIVLLRGILLEIWKIINMVFYNELWKNKR